MTPSQGLLKIASSRKTPAGLAKSTVPEPRSKATGNLERRAPAGPGHHDGALAAAVESAAARPGPGGYGKSDSESREAATKARSQPKPAASSGRPRAATLPAAWSLACQWPGGASGRRPACHFRSGPSASGLRVPRCACRPQADQGGGRLHVTRDSGSSVWSRRAVAGSWSWHQTQHHDPTVRPGGRSLRSSQRLRLTLPQELLKF